MEKILFISDAIAMSRSCLDFSCYLASLLHSKVTGIFLENNELELRTAAEIQDLAAGETTPDVPLYLRKQLYSDQNIQTFRNICESNGVNTVIHKNAGLPAEEVLAECRYADLLVLDPATGFSYKKENSPTSFSKEILENAECPVIIAPPYFDGIDELFFTYNGSRSSMYAIKQFAHLFPALSEKKVTVLSVTTPGSIPKGNKTRFREWLDIHYQQAEIQVIEDTNIQGRLIQKLYEKEKAFIIMGAYGRSLLSTIFTPNPAEIAIKLLSQPIFIAHY